MTLFDPEVPREQVNVFRVRKNAKIPKRAHAADAGMDFFFSPEVEEPIVINPGESSLLQTGVKVQVPHNCMLQIMNKSGIASKKSLITGACVVDCGYDGEIFVNLHNIGTIAQTIEPGQKVAQGVFVALSRPLLIEVKQDNIYQAKTSRGAGALGSTGDR
jgi:dUTP pyrophosphatase|tara:strand:+ start:4661 stop:5140 length:480 start_codon:yes stop_codon:yes gene_type:complete